MFDDGGNSAHIHPVGLSSPVTFHLDQQAGVKRSRLYCHNDSRPGYGPEENEWKKTSRFTGLVAALMGATFLMMILSNPRVEALHFSDVLKLVVSGMFLGFGFAGLMGMLNFPNSRKDQSRPPRNE